MSHRETALAVQPDSLLSASKAAAHLDVCRSSFWSYVRKGSMPAPHYINPGCPRWRLSEIDAAVAAASRVAA